MSTQAELADHLGITQPTVAELLRRAVIPKGAGRGGLDLGACRVAYCAHLREIAAGRLGDSDGELDLVQERARLASAQANAQEKKNAVTDGEFVRVRDIVEPLGKMLSGIRARLLALPSEQAEAIHRCKTTPEVFQKLTDVVYQVLTELSDSAALTHVASGTSKRAAAVADVDAAPSSSPHPKGH